MWLFEDDPFQWHSQGGVLSLAGAATWQASGFAPPAPAILIATASPVAGLFKSYANVLQNLLELFSSQ